MYTTGFRHFFLFSLFVFLQASTFCFSQTNSYPFGEWTKKLNAKNAQVLLGVNEVLDTLATKDTAESIYVLNELEKRGAGKYFIPRFSILKASWLWRVKSWAAKDQTLELMKKAIAGAYETGNDSLVARVSWVYGEVAYGYNAIEAAAMYCLNAAELEERLGIKTGANHYQLLGDVLYITRDYEKAIYYTRQAINKETDTSFQMKNMLMSRCNTIGLCWSKFGNYDSAFYYFERALTEAKETKNKVWEGIISGNKGQIYFRQQNYALAKPLLEMDYRESKAFGELASAANTLQWLARINLVEGKKDSALIKVKEAFGLLTQFPNTNYLQNVYYAAADVYRYLGNNDSVYKYFQLYNHLHDSIERAAAGSRLEISRIKLDNLQNSMAIRNLNKEKEAEILKRNFIVAAIVMLAIIIILFLNRLRIRSTYMQKLALQQKAATEKEMAAAREQLNMFKQNIIEKTNLIDKLQEQMQYKEISAEQLKIAEELSNQTILTEDDWAKFKTLFEKIYPGFFIRLKNKAADITLAEQRMAALTRLHLTTRQMASMLGISVDSVHKTRQRLRHRLQIGAEANLEEAVTAL